jgi:hypothetical protein
MRETEENSNFMLAALCGLLTSIALCAAWAYFTYFTRYQSSWMAILVGCAIGLVVRYVGKGTSLPFGILGAALSLATCFAGNLFFIILCISKPESMSMLEVLQVLDFNILFELYKDDFHIMDLLFYGVALYEGYIISRMPEEELDLSPEV